MCGSDVLPGTPPDLALRHAVGGSYADTDIAKGSLDAMSLPVDIHRAARTDCLDESPWEALETGGVPNVSSVLLLQLLESFPSTWRYARLSSAPVPPWLIFPTNFPHRTVTVTCAVYIG